MFAVRTAVLLKTGGCDDSVVIATSTGWASSIPDGGEVFTVRQNLFRPALGPSSLCLVGSRANPAESKGQSNGYLSSVYCCHLMCICCILCIFVVPYMYLLYLICICCTLCVFVVPYVYLLYYVCTAVRTLDTGLLARSQYPGSPATGHLDTGFYWFACVYKRMLRWFPSL